MERFEPRYLETWRSGELDREVARALEELRVCRVCPRDCDVDRLADAIGVCKIGRHAWVAAAFPHFGEEDCLRGWRGSGTIFFSMCNLRCVFCQNFDISWHRDGREVGPEEFANLMLALQERGCHNINFVTPEHVVPQIIEALPFAIEAGLRVPLVYNTSAYDSITSLELMDGLVDIYMPDFKFWDPAQAKRLVMAKDYPRAARRAIAEMHRQVGDLVIDDQGLARRGLLVRHLVMPNDVAGTREILEWLATEISPTTCVNLMDQYHPAGRVGNDDRYADIDRRPTASELAEARRVFAEVGQWSSR